MGRCWGTLGLRCYMKHWEEKLHEGVNAMTKLSHHPSNPYNLLKCGIGSHVLSIYDECGSGLL